ncbi:MAG TPA: phosphotransferase, partial [Acidimicrobiia bacterium]|nr:phosphotransferase [Acidimicrobiia bacterium]
MGEDEKAATSDTAASEANTPETPPGVDLDRLRAWFGEHLDGADGDRPLQASLISGGRSNLTYEITDGEHRWVLRRPPLGHVLPTAHDMRREYRV